MSDKKQYMEAEWIVTLPVIQKGGSVFFLLPATINRSIGLRAGDTVQMGLSKIVARVKEEARNE